MKAACLACTRPWIQSPVPKIKRIKAGEWMERVTVSQDQNHWEMSPLVDGNKRVRGMKSWASEQRCLGRSGRDNRAGGTQRVELLTDLSRNWTCRADGECSDTCKLDWGGEESRGIAWDMDKSTLWQVVVTQASMRDHPVTPIASDCCRWSGRAAPPQQQGLPLSLLKPLLIE
jgi:hypothetical protein